MNGQELKGIRLALGLSLRQLAPKLNTSHTTLDRVERGTGDVPPTMERQARELAATLSSPPAAPITGVKFDMTAAGSSGLTIERAGQPPFHMVIPLGARVEITGHTVLIHTASMVAGTEKP